MIKKIISILIEAFFWVVVGTFISFILSWLFLDVLTKMFVKIGLTSPSLLESLDALFFICIVGFLFSLFLQSQWKIFKRYNKTSALFLVVIILYLTINFISLITGIHLPSWFTFPFRL